MAVVALAAVLSFLLVGGAVGVRLWLLARRTRKWPERILGLGLCSVLFVTFPAVGLSLVAGLGPAALEQVIFALGLLPVAGFVTSLYAFTWLVFRPQSAVGRLVVALSGAAALAVVAGIVLARVAHWDGGAGPAVRPWALAMVTLFGGGMAWTGIESQRYWRLMRRRQALGLADALVANRFLLWGVASLVAVAALLVIGAAKAAGLVIVVHPIPRLAIGVSGVTMSACWYLAFLPPRRYQARLRAPSAR
jgi:hypothetical protein